MAVPTTLKTRYFGASAAAYDESTEVEYIVDGRSYLRAIRDAIADTVAGDAVYHVGWFHDPTMNLYGGATPPTLPTLVEIGDLLADRRQNGVDVRVIVNGAQYLGPVAPGVYGMNWIAVTNLRSRVPPGAATPPLANWVIYDWSGAEMSGTQHQKATVISHQGVVTAFVGGMDFNPLHLDEVPHSARLIDAPSGGKVPWGWHDAGMRLVGGAATEVWTNFADRWEEACTLPTAKLLQRDVAGNINRVTYTPPGLVSVPAPPAPTFSSAATTPDTSIRVIRSRYRTKLHRPGLSRAWLTRGGTQILDVYDALKRAIDGAQRYVYVEDQFLGNHPALDYPLAVQELFWGAWDTLIDGRLRMYSLFPRFKAALQRGVRLIFVGSGYADPGDQFKGPKNRVLTPELADLASVNPNNLAVWRVEGTTVHSKLMIIDDEYAAIGSANVQSRSMLGVDAELHTAVVTDPATPAPGGSPVKKLRMDLWREHLGITASLPDVETALADETLALGMWRQAWSTGGMWFTTGNPPGFTVATVGAGGARPRVVRAYVGPGSVP